jgi:Putative phospholipid-binding domain.
MKRNLAFFLVAAFLSAGMIAELSAQTVTTTDSATRRSSLFGASRISLFNAGGDSGEDRDVLKTKSIDTDDQMMRILGTRDPSQMLGDPRVSNRDLFMTSALQLALMGAEAEIAAEIDGGLIVTETDTTDINSGTGMAAIRGPGIYAPRLRFVPNPEELAARQAPEAVAAHEKAERELAANLLAEVIDKFDLPASGNISLQLNNSVAHLQGRVPSPLQRKQVGLYLGLVSGIRFLQNDLQVDPSLVVADDVAATKTRNGLVAP